jgi:hypothetical protein
MKAIIVYYVTLIFISLHSVFHINQTCIIRDHLSNVTINHCSLGRSHKTGLTLVYKYHTCHVAEVTFQDFNPNLILHCHITRGSVGWAWSLTFHSALKKLNTEPSIQVDASYQFSDHMAKQFRKIFFRNQPIRNKNGLWWPCLLTDRDEMSNLYRGPAIDASYQVSVHLAKRFQRRRFLKIGQSETRIAYGGHVCWWIGTKWAFFREDLP